MPGTMPRNSQREVSSGRPFATGFAGDNEGLKVACAVRVFGLPNARSGAVDAAWDRMQVTSKPQP